MDTSGKSRFFVVAPIMAVLVLVVVVLWFTGMFVPGKIPPGEGPLPEGLKPPEIQMQVTREARPAYYTAVGTIRSRTNATVAAQANGRVTKVMVDTGKPVESGDHLATLDSQELETRVAQTVSNLEAARAELADARLHYGRMKRLLPEKAVTRVQMDQAEARLRQARANVDTAEKKTEESKIVLGYTHILAPMSGVIERREVDPGDLAWPGKPLFVIHNPKGLRLEASVREGMISRVKKDNPVEVEITALSRTLKGSVDEIVPIADPVSRSILVKVSLPETEGLYPGMFGKLKIRLEDRPTVLIPVTAISDVGQLKTVILKKDGRWIRRYVTLGEKTEAGVEVLSGLSGGETIGRGAASPGNSHGDSTESREEAG